MTKMQFAFQGGGAKLGALLAAAEAVYAQQKHLNFTISRVSGTSAGAIVACILATGRDPGAFRQRLTALADAHLEEICTDLSYANLFRRLWWGTPLYGVTAYRAFLESLFDFGTEKKWVSLDDLHKNIDIFIHAVDIRTRKPKIYRKGEGTAIVDALFDSSALPFIFKSYKDKTGIFDGGLVNNFPSEVLLDDEGEHGYVAGFSFEPDAAQFQFSNLKEFAGALISTMMDNATNRSLAKLTEGHVHYIKTSTSTLDFRTALNNDLKGANYQKYVADVSVFLADFLARKRLQPETVSETECVERLIDLHKATREKSLRVKKLAVTYKSNSLKVKNLKNPSSVDELYVVYELVADKPVYTFGFRLRVNDELHHPGDIKPTVTDADKRKVGVTTFPIPPNVLLSKTLEDNVLLFFHEPLLAGQTYKVAVSLKTREVLYDLLSAGKRFDDICYLVKNFEQVDEVDLVVYLPNDMPAPTLKEMTGTTAEGLVFRKGEELGSDALSDLWNTHAEYYPIGWRGRNLRRGDALGFRAHSNAMS